MKIGETARRQRGTAGGELEKRLQKRKENKHDHAIYADSLSPNSDQVKFLLVVERFSIEC